LLLCFPLVALCSNPPTSKHLGAGVAARSLQLFKNHPIFLRPPGQRPMHPARVDPFHRPAAYPSSHSQLLASSLLGHHPFSLPPFFLLNFAPLLLSSCRCIFLCDMFHQAYPGVTRATKSDLRLMTEQTLRPPLPRPTTTTPFARSNAASSSTPFTKQAGSLGSPHPSLHK
jgi:hypothetical protein